MSLLSPFAGLNYEVRDDDLVRFKNNPLDDSLSNLVRSIFDSLEVHRSDARHALSETDSDTLLVFARRRLLGARRTDSTRAISDALDAYALIPLESDVPWESWFKATLLVGRDLGLDLGALQVRFAQGALPHCAQRARVAFDAMSRIDDLSQCHVVEVTTEYGVGLVETTVVRDQTGHSWGGLTGVPVSLGQYQVNYAPTTNLAQLAVGIADALEASGRVTCSSIRQDQLVATMFDLVTSGSYVDSLGCFSFFADATDEGPHFAVTVAEMASEEYDDVRYDAEDLAEELADAADAIEEQSAMSAGPCVVVLSALPDFSDTVSAEPVDLSDFLEIVRGAGSSSAGSSPT
ncbi:MAG: hypothetical protein PXZ08_10295 [Actinomycetota bacterium]|nr:hypothetical protein [Actinomycetota bacterium]